MNSVEAALVKKKGGASGDEKEVCVRHLEYETFTEHRSTLAKALYADTGFGQK